jgi:Replication-relaxation
MVAGLRAKRSGVRRFERRDLAIASAVEQIGMLNARQVQTLSFSLDNYTACKRRLTKLYRYGVLKRLERGSINDPYIYYLKKAPSPSLLEHNLGVSEIYVRVARASQELGWDLTCWMTPETLQPLLAGRARLAPDAYFRIEREVAGEAKNAGFFVEYERNIQRRAVLVHKLTRYADLFASGSYRQLFGIRGMRVLIVYADDFSVPAARRVESGVTVAEQLDVTLAYFSSLAVLTSAHPVDLLTAPLWRRPGEPSPVALYSL